IHFQFLNDSANAAGIAVVHSVFNVAATLLLLPFSGGLEKLATLTVRDKDEVERNTPAELEMLKRLDARFLEKPA
ncbi:Na/Pi cotransporter family protein, partial [Collinsella aerofaciens]|nr:Na/Pi cotransporter family protein [Collinsella aerofaciens]